MTSTGPAERNQGPSRSLTKNTNPTERVYAESDNERTTPSRRYSRTSDTATLIDGYTSSASTSEVDDRTNKRRPTPNRLNIFKKTGSWRRDGTGSTSSSADSSPVTTTSANARQSKRISDPPPYRPSAPTFGSNLLSRAISQSINANTLIDLSSTNDAPLTPRTAARRPLTGQKGDAANDPRSPKSRIASLPLSGMDSSEPISTPPEVLNDAPSNVTTSPTSSPPDSTPTSAFLTFENSSRAFPFQVTHVSSPTEDELTQLKERVAVLTRENESHLDRLRQSDAKAQEDRLASHLTATKLEAELEALQSELARSKSNGVPAHNGAGPYHYTRHDDGKSSLGAIAELSARLNELNIAHQQATRELSQFKRFGILSLRGAEALALCDYIQARLDHEPNAEDAAVLLRFLQDLCASSNELPTNCWVEGVSIHHSRVINWGGEAIIFHGDFNGQAVAVRSIRPPEGANWESGVGKETIKLIHREILTHRQLKHTNVVPLIGVFREDNMETAPLIVLPYYQHGSAKNWLKQNMSPANYEKILCDIIEGLRYLHGRVPPIIHGDLHSGNVLIDDKNNACLCDFGFSRVRHEASRILSKMQITQNFRFLAPELFAPYAGDGLAFGDPDLIRSTQQSDCYALGMTFYELGTLQFPFATIVSPYTAAEKALKGERPSKPDSLGGFTGNDTDLIWELLTKMWHHDPQSRPSLEKVQDILGLLDT